MPFCCCSSSDVFQSYYTVLLSSFLLPFFMHILMLLFTSMYFSDSSDSNRFYLTYLLSYRSRISVVTQGFFFYVLKVVIIESTSVTSLFVMVRGANFPSIIAWKVSNTLEYFIFSRSNLSLVCFGLLILFRRRWKVIISK